MARDLSSIIKDWSADPGTIRVRKIKVREGEEFIQLRVDLGVLQMELDGRPDGERPDDRGSMLEVLQAWLEERLKDGENSPEASSLDDDDMEAVSREMVQFYRRRICLMALAEQAKIEGDALEADVCFRRAIRDAEHNLALIDHLEAHVEDDDFVEEHAQYRPFILMHRASCQAERALLAGEAELAVEMLKAGRCEIERYVDDDHEEIDTGEDIIEIASLTDSLKMQEQRIRKEHQIELTLAERLDEAIRREEYETAAGLRDQLRLRVYPPGLGFPELPAE